MIRTAKPIVLPALIALLGCGLVSVLPAAELTEPAEGQCSFAWDTEGESFSIWSVNAPSSAIVRDLGRLFGAGIYLRNPEPDLRRTFRYMNVTLEEALDRMGQEYTLHYERTEAGGLLFAGGSAGRFNDGLTSAVKRTALPTGPVADQVKLLIANLKDDDVRWNFERAMQDLYRFDDIEVAIPYLLQARAEGDHQQKSGASSVLRSFASYATGKDAEIIDAYPILHRVLLDGLRDSEAVFPGSEDRLGFSGEGMVNFLHYHPDELPRYQAELEAALYSEDKQFRFFSAAILGRAGTETRADRIVQVLLPHLQDNDTPMDSKLAMYGIHGLGPEIAEPLLQRREGTADLQTRDLLQIVRELWSGIYKEDMDNYIRTDSSWTQESFYSIRP